MKFSFTSLCANFATLSFFIVLTKLQYSLSCQIREWTFDEVQHSIGHHRSTK